VIPANKERKAKEVMRQNTSQKRGFTLVEIMIVVAIIGLLAAIAIPNFIKAREKSQTSVCISNLKEIDGAKEQCATEEHKKTGDALQMTDLVPNYIKTEPICPSGTAPYVVNPIGTNPTCPNASTLTNHVVP
jgi:prepilin-type N-terminal cleavage/methylation domain-containing protein